MDSHNSTDCKTGGNVGWVNWQHGARLKLLPTPLSDNFSPKAIPKRTACVPIGMQENAHHSSKPEAKQELRNSTQRGLGSSPKATLHKAGMREGKVRSHCLSLVGVSKQQK